jgi:MFS family permease
MAPSSADTASVGFWARWLPREILGYPLKAFFVCLIGLTLANMDQALFGFALPALREDFGVSLSTMGWVLAISFGMSGLLIAGIGVLTDRIGRKKIFQWSIVVSSIFVTTLGVAPNIAVLTVLRGLGFGAGGAQIPITGTIVVEESPARYRGVLSGILQVGYPLGWFLASLMAAPLLSTVGWRPMFLIGLLSIPYVFVVGWALRETGRFEAKQAAKKLGHDTDDAKIRDLFTPELRKITVTLFLGEFLHVAAYSGSAFYFPTYFVEARGLEIGTATLLVGAAYGIGALGYILASFVGEFVMNRRDTIVTWSWLGVAAFLGLIWGPSTKLWIIVFFALMTMFFYGTTAVKFTFLAEHFPTRVRATGVSFSGSFAVNLGLAIGPLVVSYATEAIGWNWAFTTLVAIPLFLSGLVFLLLRPIPSGVEVEDVADSYDVDHMGVDEVEQMTNEQITTPVEQEASNAEMEVEDGASDTSPEAGKEAPDGESS